MLCVLYVLYCVSAPDEEQHAGGVVDVVSRAPPALVRLEAAVGELDAGVGGGGGELVHPAANQR